MKWPRHQAMKYLNISKVVLYPNNKAKHLAGMSKMLVEDFNEEVPSDIKELQKLPGVGRKNSQCNCFGCI